MSDVTCPNCKEKFSLTAAGYADIAKQIRDSEFKDELAGRMTEISEKHDLEIELVRKEVLEKKEREISELRNKVDNHVKDIDFARKEGVSEAQMDIIERDKLIQKLESEKKAAEDNTKLAVAEAVSQIQKEIFDKDKQIERLKNEKEAVATSAELAIHKAMSPLEKNIQELENRLGTADTEKELQIKQLEQNNLVKLSAKDEIIRLKEEEIERVKDMKMKMSVKEIGEKLEQWCENQFNLARATAFPNAHFEKDNESVKGAGEEKGTKGDYIFRDSDSEGTEFISIMFEMKDKMEDTKGETNESHLAKLDKDRKKKNCEYAILVSMLEPENELYNAGPVDMSHRYEKMYIVRPQDFMMMLSLIRNEARKSLEMRQELAVIRSQNIDYENFENKLYDFRDAFGKNVTSARANFETAIKDIDATINKLEKIKRSLTTSSNQLRLANNKTQDLSIKKLTRGNPTMKSKFDNLNEDV